MLYGAAPGIADHIVWASKLSLAVDEASSVRLLADASPYIERQCLSGRFDRVNYLLCLVGSSAHIDVLLGLLLVTKSWAEDLPARQAVRVAAWARIAETRGEDVASRVVMNTDGLVDE